MHSIWIFVSGLATAACLGGVSYYYLSSPESSAQVEVLPTRNPLLTAGVGTFGMFVPKYPIACGEIVFEKADPSARHYSLCVGEIQRRVAFHTMQDISRDDVRDPRVQARWRKMMMNP